MIKEQRDRLDEFVLRAIQAEPVTSYAVACRAERELGSVFAVGWRDVDRSLQRLRKRGDIVTRRDGSFSHWHSMETGIGETP